MHKVGFLKAVSFGDQPHTCVQSLIEIVDDYFYWGGKKAVVIAGHTENGRESTLLIEGTPVIDTALKVLTYFTIVAPLVMLAAKFILRSIYTFYLIDIRQELEQGIDINLATLEKLQELMPKILRFRKDPAITWRPKDGNYLNFSLNTAPDLTFKILDPRWVFRRDGVFISSEQKVQEHVDQMIKGLTVTLVNQLGHLVIPHAKKFTVATDDGRYPLIAMQHLDFNPNGSAQERLHHVYSHDLSEAYDQLAKFITLSDWSQVEWRYMPVLNAAPVSLGARRIALINLQEMDDARDGMYGTNKSRGLIRCLSSEEQIDRVISHAMDHRLAPRFRLIEDIKRERLQEVAFDEELYQFYERNEILQEEKKQISLSAVDLLDAEEASISQLNLNDTKEEVVFITQEQKITLQKVAILTILAINQQIAESSNRASTKAKRAVFLDCREGPFKDYYKLGLPDSGLLSEEDRQHSWLFRILHALAENEYIFGFQETTSAGGYYIQG